MYHHPDAELKLNDLVEVIGVYTLSPDLNLSFDGMDLAANTPGAMATADILAKHPPSSLVRHSILSSSHTIHSMSCTCLKPNALWPSWQEGRVPHSDDCNNFILVLQVSRLHCLRVRKIAPFDICQAPFHSGISNSHPS